MPSMHGAKARKAMSPYVILQGLAVYGLADDGQSGDGHPHSRSLGPDPRRLPSAVPATSLTSAQHAARHAVAAMADGHPAMGAPAATASGPLSVSAAAAAAAGLEDAAVLVDTAAVAALPPSLRERVEQLVCQLMQVSLRRGMKGWGISVLHLSQ